MDTDDVLHAVKSLPDPLHPSTQIARRAAAEIERLRSYLRVISTVSKFASGADPGAQPDQASCAAQRDTAGADETPETELRYARSSGETITEMRVNLHKTWLPKEGDAVLVWVNEGDLQMLDGATRYPEWSDCS